MAGAAPAGYQWGPHSGFPNCCTCDALAPAPGWIPGSLCKGNALPLPTAAADDPRGPHQLSPDLTLCKHCGAPRPPAGFVGLCNSNVLPVSAAAAAAAASNKRPWIAPTAKSGNKWGPDELRRYNVKVAAARTIVDLFGRAHMSEASLPPLSAVAQQLIASCSAINLVNIDEGRFPDAAEVTGRHIAKLVYLAETSASHFKSVVSDCVAAVLNHLGFNRGNLVVLTNNSIKLTMSDQSVQTTADVAVIDVHTKFRLVVFQVDHRSKAVHAVEPRASSLSGVFESQLVAQAIAAAMSNQSHFEEHSKWEQKKRAKRAGDPSGAGAAVGAAASTTGDVSAQSASASRSSASASSLDGSDSDEEEQHLRRFDADASERLFLLRVVGNAWTFYCAEISGDLLHTVASGRGSPAATTIRRFTPSKSYLAQLAGVAPPAPGRAFPEYDDSKLRFINPMERHAIVRVLDSILNSVL